MSISGPVPLSFTFAASQVRVDATGILAPDDAAITGSIILWWDLSERDGTFVYSDTSYTTPITDTDVIRGVRDRSPNGNDAIQNVEPNAPVWIASGQNGIGVGNFALRAGAPVAIEADDPFSSPAISQPYTIVAVAKVGSSDATERHSLMGMTTSVGTEGGISRDGAPDNNFWRLVTIGGETNFDTVDWDLGTGEWWVFFMFIDGASSGMMYGSADNANAVNDTPAFDDHDATTTLPDTYRFGAGVDGIPNIRSGWDSQAAETIVYNGRLSAADMKGLIAYFNHKYRLSTDSLY